MDNKINIEKIKIKYENYINFLESRLLEKEEENKIIKEKNIKLSNKKKLWSNKIKELLIEIKEKKLKNNKEKYKIENYNKKIYQENENSKRLINNEKTIKKGIICSSLNLQLNDLKLLTINYSESNKKNFLKKKININKNKENFLNKINLIDDLFILTIDYLKIPKILDNTATSEDIYPKIIYNFNTKNKLFDTFNFKEFYYNEDNSKKDMIFNGKNINDFFLNNYFKQKEQNIYYYKLENSNLYFFNFKDFISIINENDFINLNCNVIIGIQSKFKFINFFKKILNSLINYFKVEKIKIYDHLKSNNKFEKEFYKMSFNNFFNENIKNNLNLYLKNLCNLNLSDNKKFNINMFNETINLKIHDLKYTLKNMLCFLWKSFINLISFDIFILIILFMFYEYKVVIISKEKVNLINIINFIVEIFNTFKYDINHSFLKDFDDLLKDDIKNKLLIGFQLENKNKLKNLLKKIELIKKNNPILIVYIDYNFNTIINDSNNKSLKLNIDNRLLNFLEDYLLINNNLVSSIKIYKKNGNSFIKIQKIKFNLIKNQQFNNNKNKFLKNNLKLIIEKLLNYFQSLEKMFDNSFSLKNILSYNEFNQVILNIIENNKIFFKLILDTNFIQNFIKDKYKIK